MLRFQSCFGFDHHEARFGQLPCVLKRRDYVTDSLHPGIGEHITPLKNANQLPPARFVVVKPSAGLATKEIFSSFSLKRDSAGATIADFTAKHYDFGRNDLQSVAQTLCPDITQAINWLASHGLHGKMTGSGSAVFAKMTQNIDFSDAPSKWQVKLCDNLTLHPLAGWA